MDSIGIAALVLAIAVAVLLPTAFFFRAKRAMKRFQALTRIAEVSDAGGSLEETLDAICGILVPEFADFCMIDVIGEGGVERAAVRVGPGGDAGAERGLAEREPSLPEQMTLDASAADLTPRFFERMSEADLRRLAHDPDDLDFLRGLGINSALTVAMKARGKPTGALTLGVAWSGRSYRREHAEFAKVLSGRVALSLDNAGLFSDLERAERARAEIAETLQHGLLPPPLPRMPGWAVAAMYRPAGAENEVGGDFYDAFPVAGGWMLAIGDVTGHGAHAASVAAQARYTLRTAAVLTGNPLVALSTLNRALLSRADAALCSVAVIALDKDPLKPARVAVAGHPPPLLVAGDSVTETARAGPVLGATPDATWTIEQVQLGPGRKLVVVTDGITEAGGPGERFGEKRLHAELASAVGPALAVQNLEGALHAFANGVFGDDAAILAIAPTSRDVGVAVDAHPRVARLPTCPEAMVEGLFEAFNRRDADAIAALCDDSLEFFAVTAERTGRIAPYAGSEGLREYLEDVARVWEELLVTPTEIERQENRLLVWGRVYLRSREFGIRDMPAAWVWDMREGRFVRGEVFADPDDAALRFVEGSAQGAPGHPVATGKFQAVEHG
jgi:serine phosphatase RsbU (regulator of sigma subunit)/ketosteroid isomerase-like protein